MNQSKFSEALDLVEKSDIEKWRKFDLQIKILIQLREFSKARELIPQLVRNSHGTPSIKFKAKLYEIDLMAKEGKNSEALSEYYQLNLDLDTLDPENNDDLDILGMYYHIGGTIELMQGHNQKSEELLKKAKSYRENHIDITNLGVTINNLGVLYRRKGLLHESIDFFEESLDLFKNQNNEHMMAMSRNNLGVLHSSRGELIESKKYHEENLVFYTEKGDAEQVARSLNNLGSVYRDLGDYEYAEKLYHESIDFRTGGGNHQNLFSSYYNLIICLIYADKLEEIDEYMLELEKLLQKNASTRNRMHYEFVVALTYYKQNRLKSKIQAMNKFEKLAQMEEIDPDVTFQSIIILIELLFFELTSLSNPKLLEEIERYINLLEQKTLESSHYLYYLKSKLLRAKLTMILGNIEEAEDIYNNALKVATNHKLLAYKHHIHQELDNFRKEIHKWVELSDKQQNLLDRIKESMITDYLKDVKQLVKNSEID